MHRGGVGCGEFRRLISVQEKKKKKKGKKSNKGGDAKAPASDSSTALAPSADDAAATLNGNELRKRDMTPRVEEVEED